MRAMFLEFPATKNGVYFVQVKNQKQGAHGAGTEYTVKLEPVGDPCATAPAEPNDSRDKATALAIGTPTSHTFCKANDVDWAAFAAVAGKGYTIETYDLQANGDTRLCLFDGNEDALACDDDGGEGKGSRLHWTAPTAGTFYARVENYDKTYAGPTTAYQLQVTEGQCQPDAYEPDNEQSTATVLAVGQSQSHNICPKADKDFVKLNPTPGTPYLLQADAVGSNADPVLELYDADGQLLARNDDSAADGSAQIAYTFDTAGTYYGVVRIYASDSYGTGTEYQLRMTAGTPTPAPTTQPPPTATPTPTPPPNVDEVKTLILVNPRPDGDVTWRSRSGSAYDQTDPISPS